MKTKTPIRIVKRGARQLKPNVSERPAVEKKSPQAAARDIVATVSEWVSEFQQKRRVETRQALKNFLAETTPQASKA